ncbi:MAG TPA: DEAD/DEAH box helicase [Firmicutes bacterium]|nr:DEAD/DEAH box helicase [Bacillota bacterium]
MFNPIEASLKVKQSYIDYILTSFSMADAHYGRLFHEALAKDGMVTQGPFLEVGGSYKQGASLRELVAKGQASPLFASLEKRSEKEKELKYERPLYLHQEEAFLRAQAGKNLVITTGTGSGKTECFLLPIIQSLLEEKAAGTLSKAAVRAIIIYPMNALANDQMKRLRKIFADCPDIKFGIYSGDTKHTQEQAYAAYRDLYKCNPLPNEAISRAMMQSKPPHILITNYSMLEHMMLRPKDDAVFSGAQLRYVVLDESHVYRGATGIEVALLLRRLRARISNPDSMQYILTSATLGDKDADGEIAAFAANLCSAPFCAESIIRSEEIEQPMIEQREYPSTLFAELYDKQQSIDDILRKYDADYSPHGDEGEKLYELMLRSALFGKLRSATTQVKTVQDVAAEIGVSMEELVHLIAAAAKAVKEGTSLLKARYHFLVRALEGAYITLTGERAFYLTRKEYDAGGNRVFECAVCTDCGRLAAAGKLDDRGLVHPRQGFDADTDYFLIKHDGEEDFFIGEDDAQADETGSSGSIDENDYIMCAACGKIDLEAAPSLDFCGHGPDKRIRLRKAKIRGDKSAACPACNFGTFRQFYLGYEAATAVLATALYDQLESYEYVLTPPEDTEEESGGFFRIRMQNQPQLIQKARQFLAFSDSRADAAFFAGYMEKSYQEFLRRRGIWTLCDQILAEGKNRITVQEAISTLSRLFEREGSFVEIGKEADVRTDVCNLQATIAIMNELVSSRRSTGLVQLGKLAFHYRPKSSQALVRWQQAVSTITGLMAAGSDAERDAQALLELLILDVVYSGALETGNAVSLNAEELEYLFFSPVPKRMVMIKQKGARTHLAGWMPRQRTGKTRSYYPSTRLARVKRALKMDDETALKLLKGIWLQILDFSPGGEYALSLQDFDISIYDPANPAGSRPLYKCGTCGRVTVHNCGGRCINIKCTGRLSEFNPDFTNTTNHYVKLYGTSDLKPFYIKEHTAQLSRERGAEYQNLFIEKKLNALSSSTTFEMGVDVGTLETVFLRDVPPTPANYVQRAGRAGRSLHSAAYALTYAKLSSHDFTYYSRPEDLISGRIKAPVFILTNEKIIRRHINAVALSAFFKEHDEVYDGDNRSELLNSDGYEKLKAFLDQRPPYLKGLLAASIPDSEGQYGINDWSWTDYLVGPDGTLEVAVRDFRATVAFLESERERYREAGNDGAAYAMAIKLRNFRADKNKDRVDGRVPRRSLIDFLVRNNVLPKYGFPVDTVELLPSSDSAFESNRPQLQRDLQLAVAEYAPGSQIVADGMLYTSRYINRTPGRSTQNWEYGWFASCENEHCKQEVYIRDAALREDSKCRSCGQIIKRQHWRKTIEPRRGFIAGNSETDKPKPVKMRKPERNYRTDAFYIGDPARRIIGQHTFAVDGKMIRIESTSNDSLVVRTRTKFTVCTTCGYAVGRDETYRKKHKNAFGYDCTYEDAGFEFYLAHEFKTDVARITFGTPEAADFDCMLSVLYAMLEALSSELGIERNDINGCLYKAKLDDGRMVNNLIIYDAVAGGAGHSRRLVTADGAVLSQVINRAVALLDECDCEPSCYKCLRNYGNQKIHFLLNRKKAAEFLRSFVDEIEPVENGERTNFASDSVQVVESTPLKRDYADWHEAAILFEEYEGLIDALMAKEIPLADAFAVSLIIDGYKLNALMLWEDAKCVLGENLTPQELDLLNTAGWKGVNVGSQELDFLKRRLGREAVG